MGKIPKCVEKFQSALKIPKCDDLCSFFEFSLETNQNMIFLRFLDLEKSSEFTLSIDQKEFH